MVLLALALMLLGYAEPKISPATVIATTIACPKIGCKITGHSEVAGEKSFVLKCDDEARQIEFKKGEGVGSLVDPISRDGLVKCHLDRWSTKLLVDDYENRNRDIEKPKCFLTQWKGQMMFVADGVKGRCSFQMNGKRAEEFKQKTGVAPLYQCEKEYFLAAKKGSANAVYKKVKDSWQLACLAPIKVGEKVDDINWDTPPDYYVPEADALGP